MYDLRGRKINLYDISTGEFLKSIKLDYDKGTIRFIHYQNGELYARLGDFSYTNANTLRINSTEYLLNKINQTTGKIEETWFGLETHSKNADRIGYNSSFLFGSGSSFKFNAAFMDGIMLFEKGKITPFLAFTPKYTLNSNDLKRIDFKDARLDVYRELAKANKVFDITTYVEYKDIIFMMFNVGIAFQSAIYNKKTKDLKVVGVFMDDILYTEATFSSPRFIAQDDKGIYASVEDMDMDRVKENLEKGVVGDKFKSFLKNLKVDDNPFLLYYEFKD